MTFSIDNLNTEKLTQAAIRKLTPHDNCKVINLDPFSLGTFPRMIELRLPGDDGAVQTALWDGSLDLAVDDFVIADEYAGQTVWRISSMGGGDSGAGKVRVSKVWASDFSSVSLQTDASDNVTINTGTLTLPSDIIHLGDTDTKISFTDDDIEFTVGALSMLKLTETGQDLITLGSGSGDVDIDFNGDMFLQGSSGNFGVNELSPEEKLHVTGGSENPLTVEIDDATGFVGMQVRNVNTGFTNVRSGFNLQLTHDGTTFKGAGVFIAEKEQAWTGTASTQDSRVLIRVLKDSASFTAFQLTSNGRLGIAPGVSSVDAQLHVDQASATAAIPVLLLDQADISEEMRQFETTIGVGNAIEASGSKLLTVTHFIKDTLPGGLTRYTPYGTISTTGPKFTKNETVTTQGLGANPDIFAFGFYEFNAADANLTQASTTQTFGTASISYAAHAFTVTGGAGTVDTGVVGLRINGTSINDQGTRTTSDTETIIADITAASLDDYQETAKKWLGQVTYELFTVSGSPTAFSLDFNYGLAKYDDWFNTDFTITDIEAVGFAGANDSDFDIKLMHHQTSGWTYSAAAFTPITAANTVVSLVTDHSTDDQLASSQHMSWKRDNLSEAIDGADSEGFLIFVSSSANNAIEYLNLHIGVIF